MSYHYLHESDAINPHKLPNITVDYFEWGEVPIENWDDAPSAPGYYWAYGFPGCIPDSEYVGPFATEDEAVADARQGRNMQHLTDKEQAEQAENTLRKLRPCRTCANYAPVGDDDGFCDLLQYRSRDWPVGPDYTCLEWTPFPS